MTDLFIGFVMLWSTIGTITMMVCVFGDEYHRHTVWDKWNIYQRVFAVLLSGPIIWTFWAIAIPIRLLCAAIMGTMEYLGRIPELKVPKRRQREQ